MKRTLLLFLFASITFSALYAQDVDYVISDPKKERKEFKKPTVSDSTLIPNPDYTSYFLNATAYTLKKKNIRLSGTDIIFIKGSYGLTDNTMVSVNLSIFGTATASIKQQINLSKSVKVGISGTGGLILFLPGDSLTQSNDTTMYMGGGQAMVTLGDKQDNITAGTGVYYIHSDYDLFGNGKKSFIINTIYIGFQKQLSKKLYVMAEGMYFINYQIFTGAIGIKLVMGDRITLNFGLMPFGWNTPGTNRTEVLPIAIPLISFRMLLGKK
ncbi:MAG: hypothetical protein JKX68_01910 [Flavobacteriales bacterium]|nr:hypothetical protein [Flavobacteriales bacterium]